MGSGRMDSTSWNNYATKAIKGKSAQSIYAASKLKDTNNPAMIAMRESRDSADNPNSTPIILGLDVTGSMGKILEAVAEGLGTLVQGIYDKLPVPNPQIMFSAIGDAYVDDAPLQVTQFESDIRIAEQLMGLWFERGGGGNLSESYPLSWLFARDKVVTDNFEKRGKKGFIFTMGDDGWPKVITKEQAKQFLNIDVAEDIFVPSLLEEVSRKWEVFHLCLKQGHTFKESDVTKWQEILGERAIPVTDYTKIPEIILSILEVVSGKAVDDVIKSWNGSTGVVVANAILGLAQFNKPIGVVTL